MLPDAKVPLLIAHQIPALSGIQQGAVLTKIIGVFSAYTRNAIREGQVPEIRKCLSMAGVLYKNGSKGLKNAIESVFLYSISPFLDSPIKSYLPVSLRQIRHQIILNNALC
ncbi:DUF7674 family protein [Chitinophaga barathri]|uniref:DUF7674 domain-containing protein n=1 Tax=Chitinophaga barathri TaxID=1647451 RepID=A0A3N4M603_9BACT|nr:hypothetical protein [Chitinophaga barathri]RPD38548.1 hypothetical protein EG028_25105 [Chitinophaga barathri]